MMRVKAMCDRSRLGNSRVCRAFCLLGWVLLLASCRREEASQAPATQRAGATQGDVAPEVVALNNRGVGLMGKFEYENARLVFEQAVASSPNNAELVVNLAIATLNRQREGDEDRALALLEQTLASDPSNARAHYVVGLLRLYLQSPELAQPHFQKAVDADSGDAFAAYYLGQCLAQQKQYEGALKQYQRAITIDPRIRSAYYAASQALRALGRDDDAGKMLGQFQELERNPQARLAEFKYTRMGPRAMAQAIDVPEANRVALRRPDGPVFLDPEPLLSNGDQFKWMVAHAGDAGNTRPTSISAADIEHDGDIDIFIANCLDGDDGLRNAVCINDGGGKFTLDPGHVLAQIPDVNAALWGDVDNDGFTDVYLCRKGPNMLWRYSPSFEGGGKGVGEAQGASEDARASGAYTHPLTPSLPGRGEWRDITAQTGIDNGTLDSVDGALFDADHDGDLDIFVVNADGPNELFNNNLDGTFKPIAAQAGMADSGKGSRQVLPVDLDSDRDLDIIVINHEPPHEVWMNQLAWAYVPGRGFEGFQSTSMVCAISSDRDADGRVEITSAQVDINQPRLFWSAHAEGVWQAIRHLNPPDADPGTLPVWVYLEGSSQPSLLDCGRGGCAIWATDLSAWIAGLAVRDHVFTGWCAVDLAPGKGPSVVGAVDGGEPLIWRPGPGRFPFASVSFTGKQVTSDNKQIRSNASGIGTRFAARIGSNWVAGDTLRNSSGPGQSLQPVAIGLGGAEMIDFLAIDWSDGVFQSEIDLAAGTHHVIVETQRQLSSCPVLFAWDGERYRFITDLLGVGGIGYLTAPGEYAPPRPWENLLLPEGALQPRDDKYVLKLAEPMEEACYLDSARLIAYDLPPGWDMTVDGRMNIAGPEPTGEAMLYRSDSLRGATQATNDRGEDVTDSLRDVDLAAAPVGEMDARFIGLLQDEHAVTLSFDLGPPESGRALGRERRCVLLIDGWVEYPYSQTMFAAWQARAEYRAPTLEVRTASGGWKVVYQQFGYPAGMPRQMALPLPEEVNANGAIDLRIRTNQEVYFDRIALVEVEECPDAVRHDLALHAARLAEVGFPKRTTGPQRQPTYDYDQRAPLWDTRHQRGWYTEFGAVNELVAKQDDALAIFGPGEEIELRFDAAALRTLPTGWTRRFVLEARGWCKDMDLYTKDGETLEPLPTSDPARDPATRDALHRRWNTRYESGR